MSSRLVHQRVRSDVPPVWFLPSSIKLVVLKAEQMNRIESFIQFQGSMTDTVESTYMSSCVVFVRQVQHQINSDTRSDTAFSNGRNAEPNSDADSFTPTCRTLAPTPFPHLPHQPSGSLATSTTPVISPGAQYSLTTAPPGNSAPADRKVVNVNINMRSELPTPQERSLHPLNHFRSEVPTG